MSVTTEYTGIVHGLDELEYHRLPGLSSTGAKRILRSPMHYQWEQEHRVEKAAYDFGHAVHALVLGTGLDIVEIDADDWRTKAAKDARTAAYAQSKIPLLRVDAERARDAAAAGKAHPIAGPLFSAGEPEVSLFWADEATGVSAGDGSTGSAPPAARSSSTSRRPTTPTPARSAAPQRRSATTCRPSSTPRATRPSPESDCRSSTPSSRSSSRTPSPSSSSTTRR